MDMGVKDVFGNEILQLLRPNLPIKIRQWLNLLHANPHIQKKKAASELTAMPWLSKYSPSHGAFYRLLQAFFIASSTATATATVAPTIGLLPMPMRPIISTCAGTDEEPANCASECMRPIVSVMP